MSPGSNSLKAAQTARKLAAKQERLFSILDFVIMSREFKNKLIKLINFQFEFSDKF